MIQFQRRDGAHQCNVNQLYQPSTGHKRISQVFDGLDHVDQLERKTSWVQTGEVFCDTWSMSSYFEVLGCFLLLFFYQWSELTISYWVVSPGPPCTSQQLLWTWTGTQSCNNDANGKHPIDSYHWLDEIFILLFKRDFMHLDQLRPSTMTRLKV